MLKRLLPVIVVVLILGAGVIGYWVRPFMDLRFIDYPVIQPAATRAVIMYEHIAEMLADYPAYQENMQLVALEYADIDAKIKDAKLLESMKDDWRYAFIDELESAIPMVRVINLKVEDGVATVQLHFSDGEESVPFSSKEVVMARLEISALAIQLIAEHCSGRAIDLQWVWVRPYQCLDSRCVIGTVSVGIRAPADAFLKWAEESEDLLEGMYILELGGAEVFMDDLWTPFIFVAEELPRLSDDPAPWDQDWFYEED